MDSMIRVVFRLRALPGDVAGVAAAITFLAGRVQGSAIWSGAVT